MATKTLAELEVSLSKTISDYYDMAASANGAANGTTIVSDDLLRYPSQTFKGWQVEISSGTYDGEIRVISDYTISAAVATLTVYNAFGGQILDTITFRMHKIPPEDKLEAIDEVLRELNSVVPLILLEDFITGQVLRNGHFNFWRTPAIPFDWEIIAGTVAREATIVYGGETSLKLTGVASAGSLRQRIPLGYELAGVTLTLTGWVYGSADAGIVIKIEQGTDSDSTPLTLTNTWEELEVTLALDALDVNQPIWITVQNTTAVAAYFSGLRLQIPTTDSCYWIPFSKAYHHLREVLIGSSAATPQTIADTFEMEWMPRYFERDYGFYTVRHSINNDHHARLIGVGQWPTLVAGTDTVELTEDEAYYLVCRAAVRAIHKAKARQIMSDADYWNRTETDLARDTESVERDTAERVARVVVPWDNIEANLEQDIQRLEPTVRRKAPSIRFNLPQR